MTSVGPVDGRGEGVDAGAGAGEAAAGVVALSGIEDAAGDSVEVVDCVVVDEVD